VYELTDYGEGLRDVLHVLAHWGARSLRPPSATGDLQPGWLPGALRIALPKHTVGTIEFRIGDELASVVGEAIVDGAIESPDAVVMGDPPGFYCLIVERDTSRVSIEGDAGVVHGMLDSLPPVPAHAGVTPS
jgi:hypothetical protein